MMPFRDDDADHALVRRIAEGDEAALQQLYGRYRPVLRRYLWYQLDHDLGQVEDALQETFVSIWRAAATQRDPASVAAWIFQIAHRHALQAHRAVARRPLADVLLDDDNAPAVASPEAAIIARLSLDDALRALSEKHRAVLYLVCVQGFAIEEVAEILAVPAGTVKSRLSYARRALQHALHAAQLLEDA
jgi:RNA polymerase sigma-70 factor (ECF subfamily)